MLQKFDRSWLLILMILIGSTDTDLRAQDLTHLSLEELMDVDLIPIDVLGTHIHLKGEWMVGYRGMYVEMQESGHGHDEDFTVTPSAMSMQMHMFDVMYGLTDRLTLMAMVPFSRMAMASRTRTGTSFTTSTQGVGDVELAAHYALYYEDLDYLLGRLALSLPTGAIDVRDDTPARAEQKLPYPMQLGSGTFDVSSGLTYIDRVGRWAWGAHGDVTVSLGRNRNSYRLGNRYHAGAWLTRQVTSWLAPVVHVDVHTTDDIDGADPAINPAMAPGADPERQGETHVALQPGFNLYVPHGPLHGQSFAIEAPIPVYHGSSGGYLEQAWQLTLTWQWLF